MSFLDVYNYTHTHTGTYRVKAGGYLEIDLMEFAQELQIVLF